MSNLMPTYPPPPVRFVRGRGTWLWDARGACYLDFVGGLAVASLGHAHPEVAAAVARQAGALVHVSNLYGNEHNEPLAAAIDSLVCRDSPDEHGRVFLCNSGAEANECAIKLARKFGGRGRHVVVSAYGSFHGRTLATLHATGQPAKHEAFQPLPEGFRHVPLDDLAALASAVDPSVVAVLLEAVQGEGGVNPASDEFLQGARRICDERGALLVVDEVQTGLGRTGRWFGFEHAGIRPDVVTLAKALGNGVPIGACWARDDVAGVFEPGDHGTTYGGQPLAAAAARAVLAEMVRLDVPTLAARAGARLAEALDGLDGVASVRGRGLLLAAELAGDVVEAATAGTGDAAEAAGPAPDSASRVVAAACLRAGLLVNAVTPTAIRFMPPLTVSDAEIDEAVAVLEAVLGAVLGGLPVPARGGSDAGSGPG